MADLTPIAITKAGFDLPTQLVAADVAGDNFSSTSNGIFFVIENTDASPHNMTIVAPVANTKTSQFGNLPVTDLDIVVAAGETQAFTVPIGYQVTGKFLFTYDSITGIKVGGFSIA